jgi:hypothetical protein
MEYPVRIKKMFISFSKQENEIDENALFLRLDKDETDREIINGKYNEKTTSRLPTTPLHRGIFRHGATNDR